MDDFQKAVVGTLDSIVTAMESGVQGGLAHVEARARVDELKAQVGVENADGADATAHD